MLVGMSGPGPHRNLLSRLRAARSRSIITKTGLSIILVAAKATVGPFNSGRIDSVVRQWARSPPQRESMQELELDSIDITICAAGDDNDPDRDGGLLVETEKPKLRRPPMYKVVMLNDDYTPMEFVVEVLQTFFGMNREKATQVMLAVHRAGRATCGIYTRDVAETKSAQVNQYAQDNQHPLVSDIEAGDDDD